MIRIAVVDDQKEMCTSICNFIQKASELEENMEIDTFLSAEDFLDKVSKGSGYDVLFSDIELDGMNGMEMGKIISEKLPKMLLIFVTSYPQFAADSYLIEAYQYILKRDMEYRIPEIMKQIIEKINREKAKYIFVGTETHKNRIPCSSIIYLNKALKYVEYHTSNGVYRERITLSKAIEKLKGKEFVLIEKGIVINMNCITKMEGNDIYLEGKNRVTVSRARFTKVKKIINNYWGNEM